MPNPSNPKIPVVDLFAGPGGLGEGFSTVKSRDGRAIFDVGLSIEKDEHAHRTLLLRAVFRRLRGKPARRHYYDYVRGLIDEKSFQAIPDVAAAYEIAKEEARQLTLGKDKPEGVDELVRKVIRRERKIPWVLIGGPPCQAYSLVGRSRMRGQDPAAFERDHRHFLYREYLRIVEAHQPSVFVMENVKGLISATHGKTSMFERISRDFRDAGYELRSFVADPYQQGRLFKSGEGNDIDPRAFVIHSERFGVPQARHRVVLFGVHADWQGRASDVLDPEAEPDRTVDDAIRGLPRLRGKVSSGDDSAAAWYEALLGTPGLLKSNDSLTALRPMERALERAESLECTGGRFVEDRGRRKGETPMRGLARWLYDAELGGVLQHESRGHMASDLRRYFFAACYAGANGRSPKLGEFPKKLQPEHKNAAKEDAPFQDRFRVQIWGRPSTTVVSHISKDGHYYIHPDPSQCRSLTVREAARLQTFPDNYFFQGNRTQQYHQVGNAVPPYLAYQIAKVVAKFLGRKVDDE